MSHTSLPIIGLLLTTSPSCTVFEIYITTFTVYVTACDLGKSFCFTDSIDMTGAEDLYTIFCRRFFTHLCSLNTIFGRMPVEGGFKRDCM